MLILFLFTRYKIAINTITFNKKAQAFYAMVNKPCPCATRALNYRPLFRK